MGEVYRATDTRLGRDVAIKVLPQRLASDPVALARFEREAKAVAALSHPNILAIHDFGEAEGRHYAVTELLEGESLRQALAAGPLPSRKVVEHGRQIAEGLAAAHDRGIVHRDLKPENLFITRDGHVKILDFGLARQLPQPGADSDTSSPTAASPTQPGTVLGTAGYMAPEQVRGEVADHRADIFSFGAVLYEMLSGRRAFERPTGAETMTAVLREDPIPLGELRESLPPTLVRVVEHCLEKRRRDRFQSARDLAFALGSSASGSSRTSFMAVPAAPRRRGRWLLPAAVTLLVGLAGGAVLYRWLAGTAPTPALTEVRYLTYSGQDYSPSASPDGRAVVFRSERDGRARIWLKQLATGSEVPLTDGPMDDLPCFSPDGSVILFTRLSGSRPSLFRIPMVGGEPRRVLDDAMDAAFSPDGQRIAFVRPHPASPGKTAAASLMVAGADGSSPREVVKIDAATFVAPSWSPDGRRVVFTYGGVGAGAFALQVADVATGAVRTLAPEVAGSRPWMASWMPSGRVVYTTGQVNARTVAGTAGRLIALDPDSGRSTLLYASPDSLGRIARVADDSFILEAQRFQQNIVEWVSGGPAEGRRVSQGRASNRQPVYSPDGQWIVFSSDRAGNLDLWAASVASGELRQVTDDPAEDWDPAFGPDGRLYWSSNRDGHFEVWTAEADGSGARQLTQDGFDAENPAVSPDGRWVVYGSTKEGQQGIWRIRPDGTEASQLAPGLLGVPDVSPDGKLVLYLGFGVNFAGTEIKVARLDDGTVLPFSIHVDAVRPTSANLGRARWTPDGRIAFLGQDERGVNGVFVQDFAPGRDTTSTRRKLGGFDPDADAETFGISPDGRRVAVAARDLVSSLVTLERPVANQGEAPR